MVWNKKWLVTYLTLRGAGAMAVGVIVAVGFGLGSAIYGEFHDELAAIESDITRPVMTATVTFPKDDATLQAMTEQLTRETSDLAKAAEELRDVMPAAGNEAPVVEEKPAE